MQHPIAAIALLASICTPTWAINKCTGPDGKLAFQDAPCSNSSSKSETLTVRPASGGSASTPPPTADAGSTPAKKQTEAQRMEAQIADSQRNRRRQEFELRVVPEAQGAIARQRKQCDDDLRALQDKKLTASNNLAGATWEGSISSEMSAVATRCDTKNRELKDEFDSLKKECQALGGCK